MVLYGNQVWIGIQTHHVGVHVEDAYLKQGIFFSCIVVLIMLQVLDDLSYGDGNRDGDERKMRNIKKGREGKEK